ncbi:MarR family transcriptional regulator [Pandoraea iniqua]|uniref:MarR family transcriptional regulator n=1 Tax=Pandoraea iniqua TaxID=2508288 RepID=A0A5E4Y4B3_9BURK|nr:MarR family transcriptional regulator [Pandoraea iniqua]VVE43357.1 MarR family transcriptional regulator [Pandoraea iniqua]
MTVPNESENAIADLLPVMGQLMRRLRAVTNTRELSWSQVAVMARLEEAGPMTTADLARAEAVKPQSMGGTLAVMEAEGLVQRYPHPDDGRQMLVSLTDDGRETRRKVRLAKHDWLMHAVADFTPAERKTLVSAVDLIRRLGNS